MNRLFNIFLAGTALLALASCQKTESPAAASAAVLETPADETGYSPIIFTADGFEASVDTKAGPTVVTALSSGFNVLAAKGSAGSETSVWGNTAFSGSTSFTGGKYWPETNGSWSFYAANANLTFAAAGSTITLTSIDKDYVTCYLPYGTTANTTAVYKTSNKLTFEHILAQIGKCTITAPSGYSVSGLTVKVTPQVPKSSGTSYNIRTKTFGATEAGTETTLCTAVGSTTDNDLWLIPGDYVLTAAYTLTKGDYSKSFTKTASVTIAAGKNSNISATLPAPTGSDAAQNITFTVQVTAWADQAITATFS